MTKTTKAILIILFQLILITVTARPANAACNFFTEMTADNKNVSWSSICTVAEIDGIDEALGGENSVTNSAVLTLESGGSITINASGQLVTGSLTFAGGNVAIQTGGSVKTGAPLYVTDENVDGLADNFTLYVATASGRRRLGLMKSYSLCTIATRYMDADGDGYGNPNDSISACPTAGYVDNNLDCNDSNPNLYRNIADLLTDTDKDGYTIGSPGTRCVGASQAVSGRTYYLRSTGSYDSLASSQALGPDCYDNNPNARPGSTTCSSTHRGDGSFDYNCSSSATKCGTTYYGLISVGARGKCCGDDGTSCCAACGSCTGVNSSAPVACGASGSIIGGQGYCQAGGGCGYTLYSLSAGSGTQACQ